MGVIWQREGMPHKRGQRLPSKDLKSITRTVMARHQLSLPDLGICGIKSDGFGAMDCKFLERTPLCENNG